MTDNTLCACGCGGVISPLDKKGRPHKFIPGHSARITKYKLIENYIPPEKKICTICGDDKCIDLFYYKTYTSKTTGEKYRRYRSECIECSKTHTGNYINDNYEMVYKKKKINRIKHKNDIKYHVQEKISTWRKASSIPSNLTVDYLVELYNRQDGYCYYLNEKMIFGWVDGKVHHNSLSLDKLDPAKGYVQGNVVWCTYLANTMKRDMTEQQFYDTINQIFNTTYGVTMSNEFSIADKLRRITMDAKLGELPKIIEKECVEEAKKGKNTCRIYFHEAPDGILPFYGNLGPAYKSLYRGISHPFDKQSNITSEEFRAKIIHELEADTSLKITLLEPPTYPGGDSRKPMLHQENIKHYSSGASVILDITWE
jgi:hypothetical protein